jgi:hypothetical protein
MSLHLSLGFVVFLIIVFLAGSYTAKTFPGYIPYVS